MFLIIIFPTFTNPSDPVVTQIRPESSRMTALTTSECTLRGKLCDSHSVKNLDVTYLTAFKFEIS